MAGMGEHKGTNGGKIIGLPVDPVEAERRKAERVEKAAATLAGFLGAHTDPAIAQLANGDAEFVEVAALLATHVLALQKRCKALEDQISVLNRKSQTIAAG